MNVVRLPQQGLEASIYETSHQYGILKYWGIRGNPAGKVGSCGMPSSNETQDLASLAHLFHLLAPLVGVL